MIYNAIFKFRYKYQKYICYIDNIVSSAIILFIFYIYLCLCVSYKTNEINKIEPIGINTITINNLNNFTSFEKDNMNIVIIDSILIDENGEQIKCFLYNGEEIYVRTNKNFSHFEWLKEKEVLGEKNDEFESIKTTAKLYCKVYEENYLYELENLINLKESIKIFENIEYISIFIGAFIGNIFINFLLIFFTFVFSLLEKSNRKNRKGSIE